MLLSSCLYSCGRREELPLIERFNSWILPWGGRKNIRAYLRVLARVLLWSALSYNNVFPIAASVCECVRTCACQKLRLLSKSFLFLYDRESRSLSLFLSLLFHSSSCCCCPVSKGHRGSMPWVHAPAYTHTCTHNHKKTHIHIRTCRTWQQHAFIKIDVWTHMTKQRAKPFYT